MYAQIRFPQAEVSMTYDTTVFVGLDVHKDSITAACVGSGPAEPPVDVGTIGTQQYAIDRLIKKLAGRGPLKFVYEAGPCGFWLQRYLQSVGQQCLVAAPSLIPRRPGVRIKTDRLDARNLALALRAGTLTAVHVPAPEEEAFRDVVRAWQQCKRDVTSAKQRLKAFLLRNDIRYEGRASWSLAHRRWLARLVLPNPAQQIVFQELVDAVLERERRARSARVPARCARTDLARAPARVCVARVPWHPKDRRLHRRRRDRFLRALLSPQPLHGVAWLRPERTLLRRFASSGSDHAQRQSLGSHAAG
jgi:transposase